MDSVWARRGPDAPALRARSRVQPCSPRRPLTTSFLANHPSSHPHVLAQRPAQTTGTAGHAGDAELIPDPRPRTRTAQGRLCVRNCRPRRANAAFRILDAQHPISPWPWAWPCHGETDISRVAQVTRQLLRVCDIQVYAPRLNSSCVAVKSAVLRENQPESQLQGTESGSPHKEMLSSVFVPYPTIGVRRVKTHSGRIQHHLTGLPGPQPSHPTTG
jgi:hypothetical protein